jgi:hypothetical protein
MPSGRLRRSGVHGLGDASDVVAGMDSTSDQLNNVADMADSVGLDPSVSAAINGASQLISSVSDQINSATNQGISPATVTAPAVSASSSGISTPLLIGGAAALAALALLV